MGCRKVANFLGTSILLFYLSGCPPMAIIVLLWLLSRGFRVEVRNVHRSLV